jgi:hypothetical protein
MKRSLIEIIKPTIERKFNELDGSIRTIMGDDYFTFIDSDHEPHLEYNDNMKLLEIDKDYFMLQYFGINETMNIETFNIVKDIFFDLLGNYFFEQDLDIRLDNRTKVRIFNFYS